MSSEGHVAPNPVGPGLVIFLAEFLAFEILTLAAVRLEFTELAAQPILTAVMAITFQLFFPIAVVISTRVASLSGAMRVDVAKIAAAVATFIATVAGSLDTTLLASLTSFIPRLFTEDEAVIAVAANALPAFAILQAVDVLASNLNNILRERGSQEIGGYAGLLAFHSSGYRFRSEQALDLIGHCLVCG